MTDKYTTWRNVAEKAIWTKDEELTSGCSGGASGSSFSFDFEDERAMDVYTLVGMNPGHIIVELIDEVRRLEALGNERQTKATMRMDAAETARDMARAAMSREVPGSDAWFVAQNLSVTIPARIENGGDE